MQIEGSDCLNGLHISHFWANKTHQACEFFVSYAKYNFSLTLPDVLVFMFHNTRNLCDSTKTPKDKVPGWKSYKLDYLVFVDGSLWLFPEPSYIIIVCFISFKNFTVLIFLITVFLSLTFTFHRVCYWQINQSIGFVISKPIINFRWGFTLLFLSFCPDKLNKSHLCQSINHSLQLGTCHSHILEIIKSLK